ncbi:unnamed protein product [Rotaria sordida]|uniref:Linalool dehydratase/isomerase domain-containing protein n=1 Tax=Rotaria sordida TaxID=392033 RepID=A0A815C9E8_9BILA|nr:unnamed protein product [Rotaria sordida]
MTKVGPELTLDASQLSEATRPNATDLLPQPTAPPPPRPLPKPLTDFKTRCYVIGRLFESTTRGGQPVGDIWDYEVPIPASDNAKSDRSLSHCNYLSRCDNCRGKGLVTCNASGCNGSGWVTCSSCSGRGRTETSTQIIICGCYNGKVRCSSCKGGGKIHCSDCKGGGGFYHSATLRIKCFGNDRFQKSFQQVQKSILNNKDDTNQLLSEKELKLIRFISYLTYMQTTTTTTKNITWNGWEKNYDSPQLDLGSIRYSLAHIGYTAAALAYRIPNYLELAIKILKDSIERMLNIKVWGYIDRYWKNVHTFPDPVCHENIMYSSHLLQLLTLYESLSGDFTYDIDGFDFIWDKDNDRITKIHYSTTKLAYAICYQMNEESSAGVSCEPEWVYTICQNHPHIGFKLYDIVRNKVTEKLNCTYLWFDNNFGTFLDTDNDGYFESYYYETNTMFSNWVTTNVLLSLLMGENGYNAREFLRNIYNTKFYQKFLDHEPEVLAVEYPLIRVSRAQYDSNRKQLLINFNTEKSMILSTKFEIKYPNLILNVSNITRDGFDSGFTMNQISNDGIRIEYYYSSMDKQETEFNILFY